MLGIAGGEARIPGRYKREIIIAVDVERNRPFHTLHSNPTAITPAYQWNEPGRLYPGEDLRLGS